MTMRFGVCVSSEQTAELDVLTGDARPDFVEWSVAKSVGTLDEAGFAALRMETTALPFVPETWNVLLPGSLKIVGPNADLNVLAVYAETALARVAALGGTLCVFGSGGARTIPEGWDRAEGRRQFVAACRVLVPVAAAHGVTLALEPLRRVETNLINTVTDGLAMLDDVGDARLAILADLYHMLEEGEDVSVVRQAGARLMHVHVAAAGPRTLPVAGDGAVTKAFFRELRAAGYDRRVSIECRWDDVAALGESLAFLRETWAAMG
ncbi:MAG: sugar phosphate isomerase/epimerase family protein [Thermomicrobiales bacterium]